MRSHDVAAVVVEPSAVAAVDIASGLGAYKPDCMVLGMAFGALAPVNMRAMVALVAVPSTPAAVFVFPYRRPAHSIHSFHDHDRWTRGFVLVEAAEILTWAERGMPLNEHCRTPPNSNQERTAPDLIFLDVRRVICSNGRGVMLRIAWKRLDQQWRRCSSTLADVPPLLQEIYVSRW